MAKKGLSRTELDTILAEHAKWLDDNESGKRANLIHADLTSSNLRHADLRDADLRHADLRHADLRHTDLRHADLRHTDLRHADLRHTDLRRTKGWITLTTTDHGHLVGASWRSNKWRIVAGCRDFSILEARKHWGAPDYHTPQSGSRIVALLDWLEQQPTPTGEDAK